MVRERYLEQLDLLKESVLSLGEMVKLIFRDSMTSVIDLDIELARKTLALEPEVDRFEEEIEASIFDLLALQQPMAKYCKNPRKNRRRACKAPYRYEENGRHCRIYA